MKYRRRVNILLLFLIMTSTQFCNKDNNSSPADELESQNTKNPITAQVKMLKAFYEYSPNCYYDSIIYDQNERVKFNIPQDKYTYKYYEDKIVLYYNWNNSYQDLLAYTYKLNNLGFPTEIKKEISDYDLSGPEMVRFVYAGNFIAYKIEENDTFKDSIIYINNGSNITQSIRYRNNQITDQYFYEFDNKVNPFRGFILEIFSVEKFMNQNNIIYEAWHTSTPTHYYIFEYQYDYTYDSYNLPLKMTSTYIENNTHYINTFRYSYY